MRQGGHRLAVQLFAGVLLLWLIAMALIMRQAALPPDASGMMLAVFEPGISQEQAFARLTRAGARVVRDSGLDFIWVVTGDEPGLAGRLRQHGALGAYRDLPISPVIAGCFAVADAKAASFAP